jgi:hypothetical protein
MSPSRGSTTPASTTTTTTETQADLASPSPSTLTSLKLNLTYLLSPTTATTPPARFGTRALLRSLHYMSIFLFWRLVRYAKYAIVGSLVGAVSATAVLGGFASGIGWVVVAPMTTGIIGVLGMGVGRWGVRKLGERMRGGGGMRDEG